MSLHHKIQIHDVEGKKFLFKGQYSSAVSLKAKICCFFELGMRMSLPTVCTSTTASSLSAMNSNNDRKVAYPNSLTPPGMQTSPIHPSPTAYYDQKPYAT